MKGSGLNAEQMVLASFQVLLGVLILQQDFVSLTLVGMACS